MMSSFLNTALSAAREAGALLREHFGSDLLVNAKEAHDIKLDLDVRSQDLIARRLLAAHPDHALYGEEGIAGNASSEFQWVVDPIDGTVNYFYGIPHFCISIALRQNGETLLGVIYDPMREEMFQVERGGAPSLNGKPIRVSPRTDPADCMVSVGFSKTKTTIDSGLPLFENIVCRVRKCRAMGSAALDLAYVAAGRLDAYIEQAVGLWDIAAGVLLVQAAGGRVETTPAPVPDKFSIVATGAVRDLPTR